MRRSLFVLGAAGLLVGCNAILGIEPPPSTDTPYKPAPPSQDMIHGPGDLEGADTTTPSETPDGIASEPLGYHPTTIARLAPSTENGVNIINCSQLGTEVRRATTDGNTQVLDVAARCTEATISSDGRMLWAWALISADDAGPVTFRMSAWSLDGSGKHAAAAPADDAKAVPIGRSSVEPTADGLNAYALLTGALGAKPNLVRFTFDGQTLSSRYLTDGSNLNAFSPRANDLVLAEVSYQTTSSAVVQLLDDGRRNTIGAVPDLASVIVPAVGSLAVGSARKGKLFRVDGTNVSEWGSLCGKQWCTQPVAGDERDLYWIDATGDIYRASADGTVRVEVPSANASMLSLGPGKDALYWTDAKSPHSLFRLRR